MGKKYTNTTYNFTDGLSINGGFPVDDRLVVKYKTDLTDGNTITSVNAYKGMIVAVVDDSTTSNNGLYQLTDVTDLNLNSGWVKIATAEELAQLNINLNSISDNVEELTDNLEDLDTLVSELSDDLEDKQDKLTTGNGINTCSNIINNIRSCFI